MMSDDRENLIQKEIIINEEDTEVNLPPAPDFAAIEPTAVQPVVHAAAISAETPNAYPPPRVVYVAQPTEVQARTGWNWLPVVLSLVLVATIAGAFIGAELYKRSTYAEAATTEDVSPYAEAATHQNKSDKSIERNSFTGRNEAAASEPVRSISTSVAPVQRIESETTGNDFSSAAENNDAAIYKDVLPAADDERRISTIASSDETNARTVPKTDDDADLPPPPVKRQTRELPQKVENKKDTENIEPARRELPNYNLDQN